MPMNSRAADRTNMLLAAFALAFLFVFFVLAVPDSAGRILFSKWGRFVSMILVLFGFLLRVYWRALSSLAFWSLLIGFMALHTVAIGYFYYAGGGIPFVLVGIFGGAEIVAFAVLVYWILGIEPRLRHKKKNGSLGAPGERL